MNRDVLTLRSIIKTSIVSGFTIAAALIWRDAIIAVIETFFPPQEAVLYKVLAAVIATMMVIVLIFIALKTEKQFEFVMNGFQEYPMKKKKRRKKK